MKNAAKSLAILSIVLLPGPVFAFPQSVDSAADEQEIRNLAQFETQMEQLRQQLRIPGMAAVRPVRVLNPSAIITIIPFRSGTCIS